MFNTVRSVKFSMRSNYRAGRPCEAAFDCGQKSRRHLQTPNQFYDAVSWLELLAAKHFLLKLPGLLNEVTEPTNSFLCSSELMHSPQT